MLYWTLHPDMPCEGTASANALTLYKNNQMTRNEHRSWLVLARWAASMTRPTKAVPRSGSYLHDDIVRGERAANLPSMRTGFPPLAVSIARTGLCITMIVETTPSA